MSSLDRPGSEKDGIARVLQPLLLRNRHENSRQSGGKHHPAVLTTEDRPPERPWEGSFWRLGAISGIIAILVAVASIGASLGILVRSNGDAVTRWPIQPSVFLSISETVCSTLLRYAFATSVPITWWRHAAKGRTLARLEKEWAAGTSLFGALKSGRQFRLIALASVTCVLLLASGPFLQKASVVVQTLPTRPVNLTVHVAEQLPTNWSGTTNGQSNYYSNQLSEAYYNFVGATDLSFAVEGCEGVCETTVKAPGLAQSGPCATQTVPIDIADLTKWPKTGNNSYVLLRSRMYFDVSDRTWYGYRDLPQPDAVPVPATKRETIAVYTEYADVTNGKGSFVMTQCWYVSAILEHRMSVRSDDTGTFLQSTADARIYAMSNNTSPYVSTNSTSYHGMTIGNLVQILSNYFQANLTFYQNGLSRRDESFVFSGRTLFSDQLVQLYRVADFHGIDPMGSMLAGFNQMLFRGGIAVSQNTDGVTGRVFDPDTTTVQSMPATITSAISVFQSHFRWWAAATVIQLLCVVFIVPLFWGWWTLGRPVTLSPFEVAKALEAPLLRDVRANAGAEDILKSVGELRLRYGYRKMATNDQEFGDARRSESDLVMRQEGEVDRLK